MNFTIHKADKRHLTDINRLIVETKIGQPMNELSGLFWFIRVDGRIVACAGLEFIHNQKVAVLTHLATEKKFRRHGIGSALIQHRIDLARKQGVKTLALATMYYLFNFYKKRGFKTCPRKNLPNNVKNYWMFTVERYKKCAVMIREL